MCNPAQDAPNNDLDDDRPMDEDERLDYTDQQPLHLPTPTGVCGTNGTVLVGYAWLFGRHRRKFAEGP